MTDTEVFEKKENMPTESYRFFYTEQEYKEARNTYFKGGIIRTVAFGLLCLGLGIYFCTSGALEFTDGLFIGLWAMYLLISVSSLIRVFRSWTDNMSKVCSSVYNFKLIEDRLIIDIFRDSERVFYNDFKLADLRQKADAGRFYLLVFTNQVFIVKKEELPNNSIFHTLKPKDPEKPSKTLKGFSVALLVLSIVAGVCGMVCAMALHVSLGVEAFRWWYPYAFALIPVASFFFGWYMKKKYNGGRGNTIAGFFATMMIFCAFFGLGSAKPVDMEKEYQISKVELYADVDLPNPSCFESYTDTADGIDYRDTFMEFNAFNVEHLESVIKSSENWAATYSADITELLSDVGAFKDWDFISVYNITTDEYNKVPYNEGTYDMAAMYYYMDDNQLYVTEYEYTK